MRTFPLQPDEDAYEACRRLVSEGHEDGPCRLSRNDKTIFNVPRLYRAACRAVVENPGLHLVWWAPYPGASVDPKMLEVYESEKARRLSEGSARGRKKKENIS